VKRDFQACLVKQVLKDPLVILASLGKKEEKVWQVYLD
jgi:hypothetical protein